MSTSLGHFGLFAEFGDFAVAGVMTWYYFGHFGHFAEFGDFAVAGVMTFTISVISVFSPNSAISPWLG